MIELTQRLSPFESAEIFDSLTLPYELRMRGRLRAMTDNGFEVGLFLDRGPVLRAGNCLKAESGEVICIRAANEPVITAHIPTGLPLGRLCYHLGNRHVQLAIGVSEVPEGGSGPSGWVRFPPDHVLEELAQRLGATLERHQAPFDPESGAYAQAGSSHGTHAHSHPSLKGHGYKHDHSQEPANSHAY